MKILVATDAWHPQVNGVVRTLAHLAEEAPALGAKIEFLTPDLFWSLPLPSYPEIRLAVPCGGTLAGRVVRIAPDAIHVATEGPLGHAVRRYCLARRLPFTTSFHTRFPDYLAERLPLPSAWTCDWTWAWLRRFHVAGAATLAATPSLAQELVARGFRNVKRWPRGVEFGAVPPARRQRPWIATAGLPQRGQAGGRKEHRGFSLTRSAWDKGRGRRRPRA